MVLCLFLCGCSEKHSARNEQNRQWMEKNGKIKVLSTTAIIDDLVKQIGNGYIDSLALIQGDLDPHSYQLVKGDDEKLSFADLIFYNGLGLEHGPSLYYHLTHHKNTVPLGDKIEQKDPSLIVYVNGQKDPHIWMDISLWSNSIPFIVEALSQKDPAHAREFEENGKKAAKELASTNEKVKEIMQAVPEKRRYLVTSHDAFNYFARAYLSEENEMQNGTWTKRFAAPEGLAPESQLSSTDIKEIIDHMYKNDIHLLFPESNVSHDSINKITQAGREKGLDLEITCCPLYADAMGEPGSEGDTYIKMMLYNANMIASYMHIKPGVHK